MCVHPDVQFAEVIKSAHIKDPVVHVRSSMDYGHTKTPPACTVGWVTRLCRSWLSPGKASEFSMGEIPIGQYSYKKQQLRFKCQETINQSFDHYNVEHSHLRPSTPTPTSHLPLPRN